MAGTSSQFCQGNLFEVHSASLTDPLRCAGGQVVDAGHPLHPKMPKGNLHTNQDLTDESTGGVHDNRCACMTMGTRNNISYEFIPARSGRVRKTVFSLFRTIAFSSRCSADRNRWEDGAEFDFFLNPHPAVTGNAAGPIWMAGVPVPPDLVISSNLVVSRTWLGASSGI